MIHRGMLNFFEVKYLLIDIFSVHLAAQILMRSNYYYYNNTWNYIEWGNLYNLHVCLLPVFYQNCITNTCMWDFSIINIYFQRKACTPGVATLMDFIIQVREILRRTIIVAGLTFQYLEWRLSLLTLKMTQLFRLLKCQSTTTVLYRT